MILDKSYLTFLFGLEKTSDCLIKPSRHWTKAGSSCGERTRPRFNERAASVSCKSDNSGSIKFLLLLKGAAYPIYLGQASKPKAQAIGLTDNIAKKDNNCCSTIIKSLVTGKISVFERYGTCFKQIAQFGIFFKLNKTFVVSWRLHKQSIKMPVNLVCSEVLIFFL